MANSKNLANGLLASPVNTTATAWPLQTGYGAGMPPVPFKLTATPFGQLATSGNSEIVLVTARTGDSLTVTRAQNGTTAKSFDTGDIVVNGVYVESSMTVGDIVMSLRATPEGGRLFMDGGTYNKSSYPLLHAHVNSNPAYGTTTATDFTLADMRQRMPFGKSPNAPFAALGATGGEVSHTLTESEVPDMWVRSSATGQYLRQSSGTYGIDGSGNQYRKIVDSGSPDVYADGGGQAHNNMSPYFVINYEVLCG